MIDTEENSELSKQMKELSEETPKEKEIDLPSCLTKSEQQEILLNKQFCRLKIIKKHYFDGKV